VQKGYVVKVAATVTLLFLLPLQAFAADVSLGTDAEGTSYVIDTAKIGKHTYPMGAGGNLVGVLTPKEYSEAWAKRLNQNGQTVGQHLWVFDCNSRAGQLALADTAEASKSYDVTAQAQSTGVERYMQRIVPSSWYEVAEKVVCKKPGSAK
jgi:hypothetical protein